MKTTIQIMTDLLVKCVRDKHEQMGGIGDDFDSYELLEIKEKLENQFLSMGLSFTVAGDRVIVL